MGELEQIDNSLDFACWYLKRGMPNNIAGYPEVFLTDDATSTALFRYKRFQAELYFIHPSPVLHRHEHPGVEAVEILPHMWSASRDVLAGYVLKRGMSHGDSIRAAAMKQGFVILSCQMWDDDLEISTIGSRWKGKTAGEKHEAIIRRFNPDCYIENGYADVTRKMVDETY